MSSQSLWIQIPLILGIPLAALFIIPLIKGATAHSAYSNEDAVDIGMDLAVLATGACGSIFANDTLYAKWGIASVVYGSLTTLVCIIFIAWLAMIRRWHNTAPVSTRVRDSWHARRTSCSLKQGTTTESWHEDMQPLPTARL